MESFYQENDQVGRNGVPLKENDQVGRDEVSLQGNDQMGKNGALLPGECSGGKRSSSSSRKTIRRAEMEPIFKDNDQVSRDEVPLPKE